MTEPAALPTLQTIAIELPEPWVGWKATFRKSFPLQILIDFQKSDDDMDLFCATWDKIVVEHNFPALDGSLASGAAQIADTFAVRKSIELWISAVTAVPSA
jgi:hypothetical protein